MPKSFSEKERAIIQNDLKSAALISMLQKGIKKTTVDELVKSANIPKGTFYLFYPSKEMLLYDALMQKEAEIHLLLSQKLDKISGSFTVDSLTQLLYEFFVMGFDTGILSLMINGELDVLMRKLPDEVVSQHIAGDDEFLLIFKHLFPEMCDTELNTYSAAFRAVFFTAAHKREIGQRYDEALMLLIRGLVSQMKEKHHD